MTKFVTASGRVLRDAATDQPGTPLRVRTAGGEIAVGIGDWTRTDDPSYGHAVEIGRLRAAELERRGHVLPETVSAAELDRLIAAELGSVTDAQRRILHAVLVEALPIGWAVADVVTDQAKRRNARRRTQRLLSALGWRE